MTTKRTRAAASVAEGGVRPAAVVGVGEEAGRVAVRVAGGGARTARLALAAPYQPAEGDRVLVAEGDGELYVIGVLHAANAPSIALPGGGRVTVEGGAVAIADAEGRVLVRWAEGSAEIAAPTGDLTLAAPAGKVAVRAAKDVEISAGPEPAAPQIRVGAVETRVEAERLEVKADAGSVAVAEASVVARRIATTAQSVVQHVERFELTATRLVEKTRDTFRDASDLAQTRVGRARTIVKEAYALYAKRTSLTSTEDTSIDGSKVLLG
jgi:hypothetical protein